MLFALEIVRPFTMGPVDSRKFALTASSSSCLPLFCLNGTKRISNKIIVWHF